jgi:hypothetical protein
MDRGRLNSSPAFGFCGMVKANASSDDALPVLRLPALIHFAA